MDVTIRVIGDNLLSALQGSKHLVDGAFQRLSRQTDPLRIFLEPFNGEIHVSDLIADPLRPGAILAYADDARFVERLQGFEKRDMILASGESTPPVIPVILVFGSQGATQDLREFPELVADWFYMPVAAPELARRVIYALRRKNLIRNRLCFGPLMLLPETRALAFQGRTAILTKSEYALAELFLSQTGTVIPNSELVALFRATGKSTEGSNIRVTIFQLRLKLEMLSHSQYTVLSVYKQGYCLRQKSRPASQAAEALAARAGMSSRSAGAAVSALQ